MCSECDAIRKRIEYFKRFLAEALDEATKSNIAAGVESLENEIAAKHPR
jgi:hypothetical protein